MLERNEVEIAAWKSAEFMLYEQQARHEWEFINFKEIRVLRTAFYKFCSQSFFDSQALKLKIRALSFSCLELL